MIVVKPPDKSPPGHSPVRSMTEGSIYVAHDTLAEGRGPDHAVVIFEGDHGGTIYLTVPVNRVKCDEVTLEQLLLAIDRMCWDDPEGAGMFFERRPVGSGVAGGMGGGVITEGLWLHLGVEELGVRSEIEEVLSGRRRQVVPAWRDWNVVRPKPRLPELTREWRAFLCGPAPVLNPTEREI